MFVIFNIFPLNTLFKSTLILLSLLTAIPSSSSSFLSIGIWSIISSCYRSTYWFLYLSVASPEKSKATAAILCIDSNPLSPGECILTMLGVSSYTWDTAQKLSWGERAQMKGFNLLMINIKAKLKADQLSWHSFISWVSCPNLFYPVSNFGLKWMKSVINSLSFSSFF